jgi:small multidrug resistance pump
MISAIGHFGFGEPMPPVRIAFLVLIAIGVIGLHLSSSVN